MPYAEIPFTDAARDALAAHWALDGSQPAERLHGGEESTAYAIGEHVVRLGPRWRTSAEAEWCHGIALRAAASVPEAVAPVATRDGATVVRVDGRPMSVWPLVAGSWPDDESRLAEQAATLLARLHLAFAAMTPEPRPVPSFLEYGLEREAPPPPEPALVDPELDRWLASFHRTHRRRQVVHGDFYSGNTLATGGRLTAVLDWDEACVVAPEAEVAVAALEWAPEFGNDPAELRPFLRHYAEAGGPAGLLDDVALAQFIRHRIRREAAAFHLQRERGTVHDADDIDYHEERLATFAALRP
ncbi:phosphotransferase enzyme family protein [Saccharopolyspora taberi]|uniref:Aminoglycoside phosphotransferase domain-containing protein n=1 Tax=Saccharopolyspora taberi TaxID=60895 RepID=A0ABN3VBH6_9PSEU